jgi:hypothetical protein
MDASMTGEQPALEASDACLAAATLFGVYGDDAKNLGSERDQAFLILEGNTKVAVLKVSNALENPDTLDMEG